jgi:DNA-binding FadR family transcriptional regulator
MNVNSLVSKTLDALMEVVLTAQAGQILPPQDELSRQLGVSRTVLREALCKLEYLNVISVRPKTGTAVIASTEWRMFNAEVVRWRLRAGETEDAVCASFERLDEQFCLSLDEE